MKVLIATEKPFSAPARDAMSEILQKGGHEVALLESYTDKADLLAAVADCHALVIRSDKVTAEVIAAAKELKIIVRGGAGYDNIDCAAATERGIVAENTPGQNSNAVGELVIGMLISLVRNNYDGKTGMELKGKKLGLHAFGFAAQAVRELARGFGMDVIAFDPFVTDDALRAKDVTPVHSIQDLYQSVDFLSIHIPAVPETIKSINEALLMSMKPKAILLNTARKEVINEADLLTVFEKKPGFKYGADVAPDSAIKDKLVELYPTRVFFTPKKMAAQTAEANFNAAIAAGNQIVSFFATGDRTFQVNK